MIKNIVELGSKADYLKRVKVAAAKVTSAATKVHVCKAFKFGDGATGPVILFGDVPAAVLADAKKRGTFKSGTVKVLPTKEMQFTGVEAVEAQMALKAASISAEAITAKEAEQMAEEREEKSGLLTKALPEKYKDEDKKAGWRTEDPSKKNSDQVTTKYFNEKEKADNKVTFDAKGRMVDKNGAPVTGQKGYVVDPKDGELKKFNLGQIDTDKDGKKKVEHHSSPLSGGKVAGAGTMDLDNKGRIKTITDVSGHYRPDGKMMKQTVDQLGKDKDAEGFSKKLVDRSKDGDGKPINKPANVELIGKKGVTEEEFKSLQGNLKGMNELLKKRIGPHVQVTEQDMKRPYPAFAMELGLKDTMKLTTQQYEQTGGNEEQIRNKKAVVDQIGKDVKKVPVTAKSPKGVKPTASYIGDDAPELQRKSTPSPSNGSEDKVNPYATYKPSKTTGAYSTVKDLGGSESEQEDPKEVKNKSGGYATYTPSKTKTPYTEPVDSDESESDDESSPTDSKSSPKTANYVDPNLPKKKSK